MTCAQMRLAADERTVARLKTLVERFCKAHGLPPTVSTLVMLSLDEIVSNIILHGYGRRPGQLSIGLHYEERALSVLIEDAGKPFDPTNVVAPPTGGTLASRREGGLGLLLVKKLMDEITYKRTGQINRLKLVKRL